MENQMIVTTTYGEFRETLQGELQKTAEGFVRIGYLLKMARDTDILSESVYETVNDFARAEFGLSKDQVSRFIAINERFSEGGNSERLEERYAAFGYAKLAEILTLSDEVIDILSPELTRREIQDIKKEIKEEEKISDLEVLLEGKRTEQYELNNLQKVLHQYFYEQREEYLALGTVIRGEMEEEEAAEKILSVMAPSGYAVKTVRIQGIGRLMLSFRGRDKLVELLNTRTNEKEVFSWSQLVKNMQNTFQNEAGKEAWSTLYGEPFDMPQKKEEVAPVQPKAEEPEKPEKTESEPVLEQEEKQEQKQTAAVEEETVKTEEMEPDEAAVQEEPVIEPEHSAEEVVIDETQSVIIDTENVSEELENVENTLTKQQLQFAIEREAYEIYSEEFEELTDDKLEELIKKAQSILNNLKELKKKRGEMNA